MVWKLTHRELAGGLRVAVGHRHDGGLLQAEHVADLVLGRERIHQRQLGGAGIAEHDLDALLLEQFEEGVLAGHHGHMVSCRCVWFRRDCRMQICRRGSGPAAQLRDMAVRMSVV